MFRKLASGDNEGFFQPRLVHSPWYWLDLFGLAVVAFVILSSGPRHAIPLAHGWLLLWASCAGAVLALGWAVRAYRRIQEMNIDWGTVEPGTPLYAALDLLADNIRVAPVAAITLAVAVASLL